LNQGLSVSSGKYFAYIGSDDFWLPTFLESRSRLMEKRDNAVLGYGHAFLVDDLDNIIDRTEDYRDDWANYPDGNPREMLLNGVSPVSSTVFYRLSALENVSWNETSRLEDYEMYLTLMSLGDFAFDPQTLSAWRQHGTNTSKDLLMMHNAVMEAQRRHIADFGITEDELQKVQKRIKFRYARELLQSGEKDAAIRLLRESWTAARSPVAIAKSIAQLLMPKATLVKYQEKKRANRVNKNRDQKI
jgi:glycosyltransferase involved in cell wall biosynthesis